MVFYFTTKVDGKTYSLYMGKDKFENEALIEHGWPDDLWFHVDKLSSAHVYVRLPEGDGALWKDLPEELVIQCCQLVKANSIEGCKKGNVAVVYTPWSNLKKTADMAVGQVSFHDRKQVKKYMVEKRDNSIVNMLNKTKEEDHPDLQQQKFERMERERKRIQAAERAKREAEKAELDRKREEAKLRSYDGLFEQATPATTNKEMAADFEEYEDDFM